MSGRVIAVTGTRKGLGKAFGNMVVIPISDLRGNTACGFPDKNGKIVLYAYTICGLEGLVKIRCIGNDDTVFIRCKIQCLFGAEVWFIGKDGGNRSSEIIGKMLFIGFVRDLDKAVNDALLKRITIGLIVIIRGGDSVFHISEPFFMSLGNFIGERNPFVRNELGILVEKNVEAGNQIIFGTGKLVGCMGLIVFSHKRPVVVGNAGDKQCLLAVFDFFGVETTGKSGRPFVLVIEP